MATINIVVPRLHSRLFSGGILCIFQYAKGLTARGHDVNVLPLLPSPEPLWFKARYGRLVNSPPSSPAKSGNSARPPRTAQRVRDLCSDLGIRMSRLFDYEVQRGFQLRFIRKVMHEADVTVATSFETALPVHLYGAGRRCYFMQHFEPYFAVDMPDPKWAEHEALASYRLGLDMIANSSWLQAKLRREFAVEPALCPNAIDHDIFNGEPKTGPLGEEIRVISYGGSHATWKGFRDMAGAMQLLRRSMPGRKIRWQVYGGCILPPDNEIARYESLGFLEPGALARAYRSADILLSASWYESFPLFPLEAMACGLPVITTQPGTEEYAIHGRTAEIVTPRDIESIARGLTKVIEDAPYRSSLATNGLNISRQFSWSNAVARMESLLLARQSTA